MPPENAASRPVFDDCEFSSTDSQPILMTWFQCKARIRIGPLLLVYLYPTLDNQAPRLTFARDQFRAGNQVDQRHRRRRPVRHVGLRERHARIGLSRELFVGEAFSKLEASIT